MRSKLQWLALPILSLWLVACGQPPAEDCQNAVDDDGDGVVDCNDPSCQNVSFCLAEDCNVVGDENGNGAADCVDAACIGLPQCQGSCGDGNITAGEQCDGANLNGNSCSTLGFTGGNLSCNAGNCLFNTQGCVTTGACGDGVVQAPLGEQCDDGLNNGTPNSNCSLQCTLVGQPGCGDGIIQAGEECDDGVDNGTAGSNCDLNCDLISTGACGNDVVEAGEECDTTDLNGEDCISLGLTGGTLSCENDCTFDFSQCQNINNPVCGNNLQEIGEQCDGNDLNGSSCQSFGFSGGFLACSTDGFCAFDTSGCDNAGGTEICTNGLDDDGDGLADCDPAGPDASCDCNNSCTAPTQITDPSTVQGDTTGHNQSRTGTCVGANAPDVAFQVTASITGDLDLILDSQADLGMYVRTVCNQNTEIGGDACVDQEPGGQLEVLSVPVTAGQTVFIIVDGFVNQQTGVVGFGPFSLSVSTTPSLCGNGAINGAEECDGAALGGESCTSLGFAGGTLSCNASCTFNTNQCTGGAVEICTNNVDDDGDGASDCNDQGSCQQACGEACFAPTSIGEGTFAGTTVGHAGNRRGSCAVNEQNTNAPEAAFDFTAPQAGQLTATLTASFDSILHARDTCGDVNTELDCSDGPQVNSVEVVNFAVTANQTVTLFVDGFNGAAGTFSLVVDLQ